MSRDPHADEHGRTAAGRALFDVAAGAHEPLADLAREAGARLHDAGRARRRWVAWAMLALAIAGGAIGTSSLAASAGFTRPGPLAVMAAGYLVCFVALTRALRVIPIPVAYAVWSGAGIALVSVIGWIALGQALSAGELAGIALILVGTVVIQRFSRSEDEPRRGAGTRARIAAFVDRPAAPAAGTAPPVRDHAWRSTSVTASSAAAAWAASTSRTSRRCPPRTAARA